MVFDRRKSFVGVEERHNAADGLDENMKAGNAKKMSPFDVMAICNFSVGIEFEAVTYTRWLAEESKENNSLCHCLIHKN